MEDIFEVNDNWYVHSLNTKDDATYTREEGSAKILFKVDSGATLYNGEGKILGRFRTDGLGYWEYRSLDGLKLAFNDRDLIRTEIKTLTCILRGEICGAN